MIDYMNPAFNTIQSILRYSGLPALYSPIVPTAVFPATYCNESHPPRNIPLPDPRLFAVGAAIEKLIRNSDGYSHMMSVYEYDLGNPQEELDMRTRLGLKKLW